MCHSARECLKLILTPNSTQENQIKHLNKLKIYFGSSLYSHFVQISSLTSMVDNNDARLKVMMVILADKNIP